MDYPSPVYEQNLKPTQFLLRIGSIWTPHFNNLQLSPILKPHLHYRLRISDFETRISDFNYSDLGCKSIVFHVRKVRRKTQNYDSRIWNPNEVEMGSRKEHLKVNLFVAILFQQSPHFSNWAAFRIFFFNNVQVLWHHRFLHSFWFRLLCRKQRHLFRSTVGGRAL